MSIFDRKEFVQENDNVVICAGNDYETIQVKNGEKITNRYGTFNHSDLIGLKYGGKLYSIDKKNHIFFLHPTPALWSISLKHMTQILYAPDISLILFRLNIVKNKFVIEAGTGSTSLTHSISNTIQPDGKLFSFEFQKDRYLNAVNVLENNNLNNIVNIEHRNVIENGFGLNCKVDSIILDLPAPWRVINEAKTILKAGLGYNICIFCPCIEQVQKSVNELQINDFTSIDVVEFIERPMMVKPLFIKSIDNKTSNYNIKEDSEDLKSSDSNKKQNKSGFKCYKCLHRSQKAVGHTGYLIFALYNNS